MYFVGVLQSWSILLRAVRLWKHCLQWSTTQSAAWNRTQTGARLGSADCCYQLCDIYRCSVGTTVINLVQSRPVVSQRGGTGTLPNSQNTCV